MSKENGLIMLDSICDLSEHEVASIDLSTLYWTPEKEGETRRFFFAGIEEREAPDHNDPNKSTMLACVVFVEPANESYSTVINGSKRLVAAFENNNIQPGTPVQVKYLGKKKNKSNSFSSDHWSVQTLKKAGGK